VRIEDAGLGPDAQVRLVVSGVSGLRTLQRTWASSGAALEARGVRLAATTTAQALARAAGRALRQEEAVALEEALHGAIGSWQGPAPPVPLPDGRTLDLGVRPAIAGVVNVTDDSFSDGGRLYPDGHPGAAIAFAESLLGEGADLLDIGGESSRPGAAPVERDEELRRVLPVVERLAAQGAVCSIDTTKAEVARAALDAGATIVNDVSGARDPRLLGVVAERGAAYVLMHTRATPADMQRHTDYDDVVAEVYEFLSDGLRRCRGAGIAAGCVLVDPGIGFAKTAVHNLDLLRALRQFRGLGRPVLVGASRKSFLGPLSAAPRAARPAGTDDRLEASLACAALAVEAGAAVLRVHDVRPTLRAARTARAIATGRQDWPPVVVGKG
jgi:dihydropteroate synthase